MKTKKYSATKLQRHGYVFILPTLIFFFIFLIYPMLYSFVLSVQKWNLLTPKVFVGLKHFQRLFTDDYRFVKSFWVTVHFTLFSVLFLMFFSFSFAVMYSSRLLKFKNVLQSLIFIPVILMMVAIGVAWKFMFQTTGLLSVVFTNMLGMNIKWITSVETAPWAMILVNVWRHTGYYMVIFIAGLLDIPEVYYEVAKIDGAGFVRQLVSITIPLLKNTIFLVFISCVIFSFGMFVLQYVITEGGPSNSTEVLSLYIYRSAFRFTRFGYAAAVSIMYFLTLLVFSSIQLKMYKAQTM
jgi:ABC-type sugar transport system permease subunit